MKRFRTVTFLTAISSLGALASMGKAQSADAAAYSSSNAAYLFSSSTFSGTDAGSASHQ
jgi:hypothetical protein